MTTMNSRRYKHQEDETKIERTRLNKFQTECLQTIHQKLLDNKVKIDTIIEECSKYDSREDHTVHPDDLIDIIKSLLPTNTITRKEFHYLILSLDGLKGHNVNYLKLTELFPSKRNQRTQRIEEEKVEHWYEEDVNNSLEEFADFDNAKGSIGEWLYRCACPAEIDNYKTLIACLERYERESGLRITAQANGFDIPLGPDLRAKIKFYTR